MIKAFKMMFKFSWTFLLRNMLHANGNVDCNATKGNLSKSNLPHSVTDGRKCRRTCRLRHQDPKISEGSQFLNHLASRTSL